MPRLVAWAATGIAMLVAWASLVVFGPGPGFRFCFFRNLIDLPCPGCGMVRALTALARFDPLESLRLHPMASILVLQAVVFWLVWGGREAGIRVKAPVRLVEAVLLVNAVLFVLIWLVRYRAGALPW